MNYQTVDIDDLYGGYSIYNGGNFISGKLIISIHWYLNSKVPGLHYIIIIPPIIGAV
jgi:hypothetical protein